MGMKAVTYTRNALRELKRHGNVAARIPQAIAEYAADPRSHANNVTQLVGSAGKRMRIGDFRAVFDESDLEIVVTRVGPRGSVYE